MIVIDGKKIAKTIISRLKKQVKPNKSLVTEIVFDNEAALAFLKQKKIVAKELRIPFFSLWHDKTDNEDQLLREIKEFNLQPDVGGITVHLPLPSEYDSKFIFNAIVSSKDVDCLNERTAEVFSPAVETVKKILESLQYDLSGKKIAIVGTGFLVGQPIAKWLTGKVKELTTLNSKSGLMVLKEADLVISGVGKVGLIKSQMLKDGAGVIDFGYGGDLDATSTQLSNLDFYTPTPNGTGPILVACFFENFYKLTGGIQK